MSDDPRKTHDDAHAALHRLWSRAVGTAGYDKADWKLLERQLHAACKGGCLVRDIYQSGSAMIVLACGAVRMFARLVVATIDGVLVLSGLRWRDSMGCTRWR